MAAHKDPKSNFFVVNLIIRNSANNEDLTSQKYSELFREFYLSETNGKSSRDKECLLITNTEYKLHNKSSVFFGRFVEYTNLDRRKWFNVVKKELDETFTIPDYLKANSIQTSYFFLAEKHRFCYSYTTKENIQPINVEAYLRDAFSKFLNANYKDNYYSEINFEKEKETIKEILLAEKVFSLTINVSYSNGDFGKDAMKFFNSDMKSGNVDDIHLVVKNKNGEPIDLTKTQVIRGALENSASNGTASARIKNGKKSKSVITAEHPAKYSVPYKAEPEFVQNIYNFFKGLF